MIDIVVAQIAISCDIEKNYKKIVDVVKNYKADMYIFPELSLTSYCLENVYSQKVIEKYIKKIQQNLHLQHNLVILGSLWQEKNRFFNAAVIINSYQLDFYYKQNLTEVDKELFSAGNEIKTVEYKGYKIGFAICRDQNDVEIFKKYKNDKVEIVILLSAHYYEVEEAILKEEKNIALPIARAIDSQVTIIKANSVKRLHNKISLGSSLIIDKNGRVLRKANRYEEEIILYTLKGEKK